MLFEVALDRRGGARRSVAPDPGRLRRGPLVDDGRMKTALVAVQGAKFKASLWFVQKGYDFVFFVADVWFTKSVDAWAAAHRDVALIRSQARLDEADFDVAAHQNNPTYTNIGATPRARARTRPASSFRARRCGAEAPASAPVVVSQFVDVAPHAPSQPVPGDWGVARRLVPSDAHPAAWAFIDNHQGVASTHPIITQTRPRPRPGRRTSR